MGFKRKRSADDDSPLSTSSWAASTPEATSPTPMPHQFGDSMDVDTQSRFNTTIPSIFRIAKLSSSDLGSRTRKRFRDNRPNERAIHENTINKLFSAQRNHPHAEPVLSASPPAQHAPAVQKSTLHSFWKIAAPPVQPPNIQMHRRAPHCEDCDGRLEPDEMTMDLDDGIGNHFACQDCGKNICGTCAVVSTSRHCLQCAMTSCESRRWW